MAKQSLIEAFEVQPRKIEIKDIKDYDIFPNKELLDNLRSKIIQDLIDNNIPDNTSLEQYINDEIDNCLIGYDLSYLERNHIFNLIQNEVSGYGPITELLEDDSITEIMVNGPNEVYVEIDGKIIKEDSISFINDMHIIRTIQRIVQPLGRTIDAASPMVDARLRDGSRLNAIIPPLSLNGPVLTIRKFAKNLEKAKAEGQGKLDGQVVFRLYDTFGFPPEMTAELAEENGLTIDMAEFEELFKKYKFTPVISSPEMFAFWKKHKIENVKPVIHVETGLNRLGFRLNDLNDLSAKDCQSFSMVISHLACADEKDHFMNKHQLDNFTAIKQKYFPWLKASLSASDGAFLGNDYTFDMVRLGAAMYGINTAPYRQNQMKNVVTLKAPVLQISDLNKGEFVGYSATYRASCKRKIAIVSIGYGDGLPRSLSNIGRVYFNVNAKKYETRIIGRVSMDNIICDVTGVQGLKAGMLGEFVGDDYTLDDIARDAATISYEIVSRIGKNQRCIKKYILD